MIALLELPFSGFWETFLALIFFFCASHALADFPLQGEFLSVTKNRHSDVSRYFPGDTPPAFLWVYSLGMHSFIHAAAVWLITGSFFFALIELVVHFFIDLVRCEKWISFHGDQFLHVVCKVVYAALLAWGFHPF